MERRITDTTFPITRADVLKWLGLPPDAVLHVNTWCAVDTQSMFPEFVKIRDKTSLDVEVREAMAVLQRAHNAWVVKQQASSIFGPRGVPMTGGNQ